MFLGVIGTSRLHIFLMAFSLLFTLLVLYIFIHIVFEGQMAEFGINFLAKKNKALLKIFIILFLICILVLFDTSLINVYLLFFANLAIWRIGSILPLFSTIISTDTTLIAYSGISEFYFALCFLILLSAMLMTLFMIISETSIQRVDRALPKQSTWWNVVYGLFFGILSLFLIGLGVYGILVLDVSLVFVFPLGGGVVFCLVMLFGLILQKSSVWQALIFIQKLLFRLSALVVIFYALPVLIWSLWDSLIVIFGREYFPDDFIERTPFLRI